MTDFEFLMGFQSVLLGLAVAELLSRLADAIGARKIVRIGWLTPLLALTVFMIAIQVWLNLWFARDRVVVDGGVMFVSALNSAGFYLAAALVFPRQLAKKRSALDDHYRANKRAVVAIILVTTVVNEIAGVAAGARGLPTTPTMVLIYALYFPPLLVLLFSRSGRLDIAAMAVLIVQYLVIRIV